MNWIYGKPIAAKIDILLKEEFKKLQNRKCAIIQLGNDESSTKYIELKKKKGEELGIVVDHIHLDENIDFPELSVRINRLNRDPETIGIMVQSPIKTHDLSQVANEIRANKDFDGMSFGARVLPATPVAIITLLLQSFGVDSLKFSQTELDNTLKELLNNKDITIINDSIIIGKPLAKYFENLGLRITICNKFTKDLAKETIKAEIIITATGVGNLIKPEMIQDGVRIIDCGFPQGDVDPECHSIDGYLTPVPAGVGPVTVSALFWNLYKLQNIF